MIHQWKGLHEYYNMKTQKCELHITKVAKARINVSAVMFCKQCLAYAVHIDWCYHSIHKHSSRSQHAPI